MRLPNIFGNNLTDAMCISHPIQCGQVTCTYNWIVTHTSSPSPLNSSFVLLFLTCQCICNLLRDPSTDEKWEKKKKKRARDANTQKGEKGRGKTLPGTRQWVQPTEGKKQWDLSEEKWIKQSTGVKSGHTEPWCTTKRNSLCSSWMLELSNDASQGNPTGYHFLCF